VAVTVLVITVIVLALFFTYTNGFQDGSSVTACALSSRAMTPAQAVVLVCIFELAGAVFGGSAVAGTIQSVTSWPARTDLLPVLVSGLIAAISWNYITRALGIPSSSTHALVGGILGAIYAASGLKYIVWGDAVNLLHPHGVCKVVATLFVAPLAGLLAGYAALNLLVLLTLRASMRVNEPIRWLQWPATAVLAFAHGANDPQKSMGIIMLCLHALNLQFADVPIYVRLGCGLAIAAGVASLAPGIVKRVGTGIFKMRNSHALSAEVGSASVVLFGSLTGGPVSASQVIASSVMGVGSAVHMKNVHWIVAKDMLLAWFLTIPCSAILSAGIYSLAIHWLNRLI
jgi:PiT family inorganic phosphate transporter